jgi:hypothetical protein
MSKLERFQIKGAPTCRVVYPDGLFEKKPVAGMPESEPKYNAFILVPKADVAKFEQVNAAYAEAFKELQGKGFTGKTVKAINPKNNCFIDGDEYADEKEGREAFRGYIILKCSSKNFRPVVTDKKKLVITNGVALAGLSVEKMSDEELCDGDYVFAAVSFWVYVQKTFQGIGCNIHAVVRMAEGERIGGISQDVEDYIDMEGYE